jgi:hypothetical protein
MDLTGMMVSPDGTATPMDPIQLGDGDILGDGQLGPQDPANPQPLDPAAEQNEMAEQDIRNALVTKAYGTTIPQRAVVAKD